LNARRDVREYKGSVSQYLGMLALLDGERTRALLERAADYTP
jgi:hypothetical protein